MLLYNSTGNFVAGFGFNLTTYQQEPLPDSLLTQISNSSNILNIKNGNTPEQGIIVIPTGPLMVASNPIASGSSDLADGGVLVLARYFDAGEIEVLSRSMQLPVSLKLYSQWHPANSEQAQSLTFSVPLDTNYIAGYEVVKDLDR